MDRVERSFPRQLLVQAAQAPHEGEPGGSVLAQRVNAHLAGEDAREIDLSGGHLELVAAVSQLADESVPHEPVPVGAVIGEHRGSGYEE